MIPTLFVRHAEVEGRRVLFDLNTESYRVLDPVASTMWAVLIGERAWTTDRQMLADTYDVSTEALDNDLAGFAASCLAQNLLGDAAEEPPLCAPNASPKHSLLPATLHAIQIFYQTRHALKHRGFRATYENYARIQPGLIAPGLATLPSAIRAFGRAEHFFLSQRAPNDCLVRSLSLFRFLRERSFPAEHIIGVGRMPFQAHAWVECRGQPVLDERGHSGIFTPLARLTCSREQVEA